jgi:adenine/guanine phosphoribosyltransferase-like PRPP-binding protein
MQGRNALDLGEVLKDITPPDLSLAMGELKVARRKEREQDLFAEKKRKGWDKTVEARCDFTNKPRLTHRAGLYFISLWQKSVYGRTLTDIKGDDSMVDFFTDNMARLITEVLGPELKKGDWCIITTPKRRHLVKNFATRISEAIAARLGIPFYEDVCSCKNRQRMNAVFTVNLIPKEQNVICFDDFVTTGNTLKSMKVALEKYKHNILFFSGINNKL